jgi:hypothetical protein
MSRQMSRGTRNLVAAHAAGDALLLGLAYYWLGTSESSGGALLWSGLVAAFVFTGACALHGAAFAWFGGEPVLSLRALKRLAPFAVAALAVAVVYWLLALWGVYSATPAFQIASFLTLKLRIPVKPASVQFIFNAVLWIVRWAILPALLLPMFSGIACGGWRGLRAFGAMPRRLYWLEVPALLLCAFWLPFRLLGWVPHVGGFWVEALSFILRFAVAYLLFVGAWLLLVFRTSVGKPVLSQENTVVSP